MGIIKKKYILILLIILVVLIQFNIVQQYIARVSTTIYVNIKYDEDFTFQNVEYNTSFGDYFVAYKDENGRIVYFTVTPNFFPIYVSNDPLDQPMKD